MTDIWLLSDLHDDFEAFTWPRPPKHDVLVVAGDARDNLHQSLRWVRETAPTLQPILYVPGNHDAWDCNWPQDLVTARSLADTLGIHLLAEGEAYVHDRVRFLGATLWTDFRLNPEAEQITRAKHDNGDFHDRKRITASAHDHGQWLAHIAIAAHREHRTALERELAVPHAGPTLVVTHHAPHESCLRDRAWRRHADGTYASDLTEMLQGPAAPDLWLHGHIHVSRDHVVGRTRIVANARGYKKENPDFDAMRTVTV